MPSLSMERVHGPVFDTSRERMRTQVLASIRPTLPSLGHSFMA